MAMTLTLQIVLLVAGVVVLAGALFLARLSWRNQQETGLPVAGISVVYSDSGAWEKVPEALVAERFGLTGKPDYVVETPEGLVPIELKPLRQAAQPYESDIMQLAAYCLLLEEAWQHSPPYGLLRYRDQTYRIEWNDELRQTLLETLDQMRELEQFPAVLNGPLPDPQHDMSVRCRSCGFHYICYPD